MRSGETAEEFARGEGVAAQTLRHWKWRFGAEGKSRPAKRMAARFVEVVAALPSRGEGSNDFEVMLTGGVRVRVPSSFDDQSLRRLLSVLGD